MRVLIAFFAALASFAGSPGVAEAVGRFKDGNQLYAQCINDSLAERRYCSGYIIGIIDLHNVMVAEDIGPTFCPPRLATEEQHKDVVTKWLRAHREQRQDAAATLVVSAVREAFPCEEEKP